MKNFQSIFAYKVAKDTTLELLYEMMLLTSPIGVFVESKTGDIWIAAHPVIHESAWHYTHPENQNIHSPSQILRIRIQVCIIFVFISKFIRQKFKTQI